MDGRDVSLRLGSAPKSAERIFADPASERRLSRGPSADPCRLPRLPRPSIERSGKNRHRMGINSTRSAFVLGRADLITKPGLTRRRSTTGQQSRFTQLRSRLNKYPRTERYPASSNTPIGGSFPGCCRCLALCEILHCHCGSRVSCDGLLHLSRRHFASSAPVYRQKMTLQYCNTLATLIAVLRIDVTVYVWMILNSVDAPNRGSLDDCTHFTDSHGCSTA
jgi:hypothetical protein